MKRSLPLVLFTLTIAGLSYAPAQARPLVQSISQSQAQGLVGSGAQVIVWPGSGTNIDFTRTGETIQRAWLDDPSGIVVDFDGSLGKQGGASLVHLKRIRDLSFPNLPKTETTLLTIVTQSDAGKKIYLFQVSYGDGEPQYANLVVTPDSQIINSAGLRITDNQAATWAQVERGLQRAIDQGLLQSSSPVVGRVQTFLISVRSGQGIEQAARRAEVSLEVIAKLAEMGRTPTALR